MIPTRIGLLTGSQFEARCLEGARPLAVACSGADGGRAHQALLELVDAGADGLVSFGFAGGLDPRLGPGDLLVPERVLVANDDRGSFEVGTPWRQHLVPRLTGAGLTPCSDAILASDRMIAGAAEKAKAHGETGAVAVDMESHVVGAVAASAGIPWLVVRAIADPAGFTLPAFLDRSLSPDGRVRFSTIVGGLMRRPDSLAALIRLSRHSRRACTTLTRAGRVLLSAGPTP